MKPISVLIADVHYSLPTLKLADAAMRQAIAKANELNVPVIVAGDLHDTKANLRGECVNAMVETFKLCRQKPYVIIGNHDRINEKSPEHSLNFLKSLDVELVTEPTALSNENTVILLPYYDHPLAAKMAVKKYGPNHSILVMHQGLNKTQMGDYIQDKSALNFEDVSKYRIISGHYHARQTVHFPEGGKWDYIGNPYTLSFGEANDPEKGFQILYDDGSLEFVPTNLRKHVIWDLDINNIEISMKELSKYDLLWVKIKGTHEELNKCSRAYVSRLLDLDGPFKLDLIPLGGITEKPTKQLASAELMDSLIDSLTNTSDERKTKLKELWRHLGS